MPFGGTLRGILGAAAAGGVLDLSAFSYASKLLAVQSVETTASGICMSSNGQYVFICGRQVDEINRATLSTPYDITTATFDQVYSVTAFESFPMGIAISPNGEEIFLSGTGGGGDIHQITLSTAYDLTSASLTDSFDCSSQTTDPLGIDLSPDGETLIATNNSNDVYQYTMTTGFDLTSISYASKTFDISSVGNTITGGVRFTKDGAALVFGDLGGGNQFLRQLTLSTPYDVSTASNASLTLAYSSETSSIDDFCFGDGDTKIYTISNGTDDIFQYGL